MFMKPVQGVVVNQVCPMSMSSGAGSLKLQCCGPKCAAWVWDWYREEIGKDMAGFNKMDAEFGHSLAGQEFKFTPKQAKAAFRIMRKYKRQIPQDLYSKIYGG